MSNELLKQEIERAMDNAPLQKALKNFTTAYPGNRARVYKGYDFEALREKVHEVKSYARDHLDEVMAETKPFPKFAGIITGPSRTADIECVGTVGVHGPRQYSVIVVEDE